MVRIGCVSLVGDGFGDVFGDDAVVELVDGVCDVVLDGDGVLVGFFSATGTRAVPPNNATSETIVMIIQCRCMGFAPFFSRRSCSKNHAPGRRIPKPMRNPPTSRPKVLEMRMSPPRMTLSHERIIFHSLGFS